MTQKPHKPNVIPSMVRVALVIWAVCLFAYICAALAIGYTYVPGKYGGGIFLSGFPTLLVVLAASGLLLAALLTVVDHYDRRPNEASYVLLRKHCLRIALCLLVSAPLTEIAIQVLAISGIGAFPEIHGFAENYTFYSGEMGDFLQYVEPIANSAWLIAFVFLTGALAYLIERYSELHRLAVALFAIALLNLSVLAFANSTKDFLSGRVDVGSGSSVREIRAVDEPALFNSVLLTGFSVGGTLFAASLLLLAGALTDRPRVRHIQPNCSLKRTNQSLRD